MSAADRARVPHHGLDLVDPDEPSRSPTSRPTPAASLADLARADGIALLVGGTGFYLRAVARGLDTDALPSDPAVRARLEAEAHADGLEPLVARLQRARADAGGATDLANPRRVVRALEIAEIQGDAPRPPVRGYAGPLTWLGLQRRTGRASGGGSSVAPGGNSTTGSSRKPAGCASGSTRACRRSRPSATAKRGPSSTGADAARPPSPSTPSATQPSRSASARGSAREPDIAWLDATTEDPFAAALAVARTVAT